MFEKLVPAINFETLRITHILYNQTYTLNENVIFVAHSNEWREVNGCPFVSDPSQIHLLLNCLGDSSATSGPGNMREKINFRKTALPVNTFEAGSVLLN